MQLLFIFFLNFLIYSTDVFVRTVDMNEFSESLRLSQKLIEESQLIKILQEEPFYNGTVVLPCHSSALCDLEMLAQSENDKLFLPVKQESLYDLYKLAHYMQISQNRMRAIQRELCYSMDEFRALPVDIKAMLQNDIALDVAIQYQLIKKSLPERLPNLHFDINFTVFNKKFIGRIIKNYREQIEPIEIKKFYITRKKKKIKKIFESNSLELYSLKKLFHNHSVNNSNGVTPEQFKLSIAATIPLQNHSKHADIFSFGKYLFVYEKPNPASITIFEDMERVFAHPISNAVKKIAFNKNSSVKIAWALLYGNGFLQVLGLPFDDDSGPKIQLNREIGKDALFDLLFDKQTNYYRVTYFSPNVDNGKSITHIYWNTSFDNAVQQKIKLTPEFPLKRLGLCYGNNIFFCCFTDKKMEKGFVGKKSYIIKHSHDDCEERTHYAAFDLSTNGLINYTYFGSGKNCMCSLSHTVSNSSYLDLAKNTKNREILGNNFLLRKTHDSLIFTSLQPIMTLYKELLPQFKKSEKVQEVQNNNNVTHA